ncbi:EF-hand domain-containing protein [Sphingosinicella sp. LHD-64]|uniref:EF-hand domain-containing protein n=1 Tax=Sphingosinicella sp. LHD-64 TaxID=3072139 RepID=UPI00280CFA85|nr:EF-hand domain-containing protein [Sphingosinicella sp. LHD-64]MDQ8756590.1 EF-hand domain-containing protein [Sphingosinicella sp. LHD-64]
MRIPLLISLSVLFVAGTPAPGQDRSERIAEAAATRPFVSPAGQVFRPDGESARPAERWFAAADANGDGVLDLAEFGADFERAFAELDRDGDGEIDPEDVQHYEQVTLPEMATSPGRAMQGRGGGRLGRRLAQRRGNGERAQAARAMLQGAARFSLLSIAHPVMDADADFNRGVSRAEFAAAADRRFAMLDAARDGRLVLADMIAARREALRGLMPNRRGES